MYGVATSPRKHCTAMLIPRSVVTQEVPPEEQEVGVASSCRGQGARCTGARCTAYMSTGARCTGVLLSTGTRCVYKVTD